MIRSTLKKLARRVLHHRERTPWTPPPPPEEPPRRDVPEREAPSPTPEAAEVPAEAGAEEQGARQQQEEVSRPLDAEAIQRVLDQLVRPALMSHGGDVELVRVEGRDVYVKLLGACYGCPSATATLRQGVETILKEEFPEMRDLVNVV